MTDPATWTKVDADISDELRDRVCEEMRKPLTPVGGWRYGDKVVVTACLKPEGWTVTIDK